MLNQVEQTLNENLLLAIGEANHQRAIGMEVFTPSTLRKEFASCQRMNNYMNYITKIHEIRGSEMDLRGGAKNNIGMLCG